jgi:hypothetical protein
MGPAADIAAADQRLTDLARAHHRAARGDDTSLTQRRCDILFDLLLGRIPNRTHPDAADHDGDVEDANGARPYPGPVSTVIGVVVPVTSLVGDRHLHPPDLHRPRHPLRPRPPHPDGETAGWNTDPQCRRQHRAKTHAGFSTSRAGPQVTVTAPTRHTYTRADPPLPVGDWATDSWETGLPDPGGRTSTTGPTAA